MTEPFDPNNWRRLDHLAGKSWQAKHCTCTTPAGFACLSNLRGHACDRPARACGGYCRECFEWKMAQPTPLKFAEVRAANLARSNRWHPGFPDDDDWSLADWSNAMCGEAGETANVVKKLRRYETGHPGQLDPPPAELKEALADELADVFLYLDLLATKAGVNLELAIRSKFNKVSERQGFPERLAMPTPHPNDG